MSWLLAFAVHSTLWLGLAWVITRVRPGMHALSLFLALGSCSCSSYLPYSGSGREGTRKKTKGVQNLGPRSSPLQSRSVVHQASPGPDEPEGGDGGEGRGVRVLRGLQELLQLEFLLPLVRGGLRLPRGWVPLRLRLRHIVSDWGLSFSESS